MNVVPMLNVTNQGRWITLLWFHLKLQCVIWSIYYKILFRLMCSLPTRYDKLNLKLIIIDQLANC